MNQGHLIIDFFYDILYRVRIFNIFGEYKIIKFWNNKAYGKGFQNY